MSRIVQVRAINRTSKVRVQDTNGNLVVLNPASDTSVDLDLAINKVALSHHSAIGQFYIMPSSTVVGTQNLNFAENKRISFTSNTPAGGISRLIEFHMTTTYDRPWISWFDENARHRVALGYHTTDVSEGGVHQAFEVKTVADGSGSFPNDMRTRFSIGTNSDRVLTGFNYTDIIEINQGEAPPTVTPVGIQVRGYKRDGSAQAIIAQIVSQVENANDVTTFIDSIPLDTTRPGQIVLMKSSLSSSASSGIYIKTSNSGNPNGNQFVFKNRTGVFEITNAQTVPSGNIANTVQLYVEGGLLKARSAAGNVTVITAT